MAFSFFLKVTLVLFVSQRGLFEPCDDKAVKGLLLPITPTFYFSWLSIIT